MGGVVRGLFSGFCCFLVVGDLALLLRFLEEAVGSCLRSPEELCSEQPPFQGSPGGASFWSGTQLIGLFLGVCPGSVVLWLTRSAVLQVLSAVIQEEQLEVSLTLSFASGGQNQQVSLDQSGWTLLGTQTQTGRFVQAEPEGDPGGPAGPGPGPASPAQTLSSVTERSRDGVNGNNKGGGGC